jgi:hypothetical protein
MEMSPVTVLEHTAISDHRPQRNWPGARTPGERLLGLRSCGGGGVATRWCPAGRFRLEDCRARAPSADSSGHHTRLPGNASSRDLGDPPTQALFTPERKITPWRTCFRVFCGKIEDSDHEYSLNQ